jgi:hypothetical protein
VEAARGYNADHNDPPEPDAKVVATAKQVWRYLGEGRCFPPKSVGYATVTAAELQGLAALDSGSRYADALTLLVHLKRNHGARAQRGETFAIAATGMARARVIPGWTDRKRYLRAIASLQECGLIQPVSAAQPKRMRAAHYQFGSCQ